MVLLTLAILV